MDDKKDLSGDLQAQAQGIFERAKAIIMSPAETWPKIAGEDKEMMDIFLRYALPLIAIGPIASFIGGQAFGYGGFGISYRPGFMGGLTTAIVSFVLAIAGLFIVYFIANWLAPKFDGEENKLAAFKLVAYSMTAAWAAGIFGIIPALGILGIVGLYSLYLFYKGAPTMMKVPEDKAIGYTAVTVIAAIVVNFVLSLLAAPILGLAALGGMASASSDSSTISIPGMGDVEITDSGDNSSISIPGVGTINSSEMEEAADRMERAANGELPAVELSTLQAMLPASIGSYQRTETSTTKMGNMGSQAQGTYEADGKRLQLSITDTAALGGLASMGAAMGVEQNRETADGFERIGTVDGQWRVEEWSNSRERGKYGVMVGNRFQVEASGNADSFDQLKAIVNSVDLDRLADMAE